MKKTFLSAFVCGALAVTALAKGAEAPAFSDPAAVVIDLASVPKKAKDEIFVVNGTHEPRLSVEVSVYGTKGKSWERYGTATLYHQGHTVKVQSALSGTLKRRSHVAIRADASAPVRIECRKEHNDLYVFVLPAETAIPAEAFTVDLQGIPGDFEDNVRMRNFSGQGNIAFDVFVRQSATDGWSLAGVVFLGTYGDVGTMETPLGDLSRFRYFAVAAQDGSAPSYAAEKRNNDLYITVSD